MQLELSATGIATVVRGAQIAILNQSGALTAFVQRIETVLTLAIETCIHVDAIRAVGNRIDTLDTS